MVLLPTRRRSATSGIRSSERAGLLDGEPGLGAKACLRGFLVSRLGSLRPLWATPEQKGTYERLFKYYD